MTVTRTAPTKLGLTACLVVVWLLVAATSYAASFPALPSIAVSAGDGMFTRHATPVGSPILLDALLTVEQVVPQVHVDVYIGVILPDGRFASFAGDPKAPQLSTGALPVPLFVNVVRTETQAFRVAHTFVAAEPQGWYALYGVVVPTGQGFFDPHTWINASFSPLLVHPASGPVTAGP